MDQVADLSQRRLLVATDSAEVNHFELTAMVIVEIV